MSALDAMMGHRCGKVIDNLRTMREGADAARRLLNKTQFENGDYKTMLRMKTPAEINDDVSNFAHPQKRKTRRQKVECKTTEDEDMLEAWGMMMDGIHRNEVCEWLGISRWILMQRFKARGWDSSELPRSKHRKQVK